MAKPPKQELKRSERVPVLVYPDEKAALEELAKKRRESVSNLVRTAALDALGLTQQEE